jgi:hypothetical protein
MRYTVKTETVQQSAFGIDGTLRSLGRESQTPQMLQNSLSGLSSRHRGEHFLSGAVQPQRSSFTKTAGETIASGNCVFISTDGKVYSANGGTTAEKNGVVGIVTHAVEANQSVNIIYSGIAQGRVGQHTIDEGMLLVAGTTDGQLDVEGTAGNTVGKALSGSNTQGELFTLLVTIG